MEAYSCSIFAVAGWGAYYIPWYYRNVIQKPYHNFPEPVAKKLRRAIFYSRGQHLDVREANKYFRQALQLATDMGMDPFSDEIMGVKYAIAALFEEQGYYSMACDVLEIMRADTQRWIDEFSDKHITNGNRSRVKKNMVQINLKLGQLYDCKYVNEPQDAERRLVQAVELSLGELQRRETEGVKQGEGDWMTNDEMGATLEGMFTGHLCATLRSWCATIDLLQHSASTTNRTTRTTSLCRSFYEPWSSVHPRRATASC